MKEITTPFILIYVPTDAVGVVILTVVSLVNAVIVVVLSITKSLRPVTNLNGVLLVNSLAISPPPICIDSTLTLKLFPLYPVTIPSIYQDG